MKICADVPRITLPVTPLTKFSFHVAPGAHSAVCSSISWKPFNIFPWKFVQMFVALLWSSLHYNFLFTSFTSPLKAMLGYFWINFFSVCSSISWESCKFFLMKFCADVFSITLTVTTLKKKISHHLSPYWEQFCGILGALFEYFWVPFWELSYEVLDR